MSNNNKNNKNNNNNAKKAKKKGGANNKRGSRAAFYAEHLTAEEVQSGIDRGELLRGQLRIASPQLAYVSVPGFTIDLAVEGAKARNRAFDQDWVVVRVEENRARWRTTTAYDDADKTTKAEKSNKADKATNEPAAPAVASGRITAADLDHAFNAAGERLQATAEVVYIDPQERAIGDIVVGWLRSRGNSLDDVEADDQFYMLIPTDQKLPTMLVLGRTAPAAFKRNPQGFESKLVACRMIDWKATSRQPLASFHEVVGESFSVSAATRALLMQYQVVDKPHKPESLACLPEDSENWTVSAKDLAERRDYRSARVFTIDPATARDLDDALHLRHLENGNVEMGVHIADVTAFLPAGCALDIEAQQRATTVYLNERSIPMLPRVLCDNLCSLHPNVDRLAFSVVWELTPDGHIVSEWFGRTVICSCSKMAYGVAQMIIEGKLKEQWSDAFTADELKNFDALGPYNGVTVPEIVADVSAMQNIAKQLRDRRFLGGSLSLHNVKLSFHCDKNGQPVSARPYVTREANHMIEEFMLLANNRVARKLVSSNALNEKGCLLRNHAPPAQRALDKFSAFVQSATGVSLNTESSLTLGRSLAELKEKVKPAVFMALQDMGTRPMNLAMYFSTGELSERKWHHYGLNMARYTHFTSPIRRYADVLVHRQLHAALLADAAGDAEAARKAHPTEFAALLNSQALQIQADHCNVRKLAARKCQDGQAILLVCLLVRNKPAICDGVVVGLGDRFLSVFVPHYGITEKVYMRDLTNVNGWMYNEEAEGAHADGFVPGETASLVMQWTLEYDENDPAFSVKQALAEVAGDEDNENNNDNDNDDDDDESDEDRKDAAIARRAAALAAQDERNAQLQDEHMRAAGRRSRQAANKTRDRSGRRGSVRDADERADERGSQPSQLPSVEQRLRLLDVVRVAVSMRDDVKRASLRVALIHPKHPEFSEGEGSLDGDLENENIDL